MESNYWLERKEAIRAEINAEYAKKLEDARLEIETKYNEKLEEVYKETSAAIAKVQQDLEVRLYNEFDAKLKDGINYVKDNVDKYLDFEWTEIQKKSLPEIEEKFKAWRASISASEMVDAALSATERISLQDKLRQTEAHCMRLETDNKRLQELLLKGAK